MTWRAYVVDDEPLAVERLVRLLDKTGRVSVAGSTTSPESALAFLRSHPVDVLLLDISMPGMNAFELLAKLETPPWVIFSTAFDEFALKAFEVHALDYLVKPVDEAALARALDKLDRVQSRGVPIADLRRVWEEVLSASRARAPKYPDRLASRLGDRVSFVDVASVTHVYAEDKGTYAVADGKTYSIDVPLAELEQRLDPARFVRIHRSTIVNLRWVAEMHTGVGAELILRLRDGRGTELTVSRTRAPDVRARLGF